MDKSIAQVASYLELYVVFTQGLRFGFFVGGGVILFLKGLMLSALQKLYINLF